MRWGGGGGSGSGGGGGGGSQGMNCDKTNNQLLFFTKVRGNCSNTLCLKSG